MKRIIFYVMTFLFLVSGTDSTKDKLEKKLNVAVLSSNQALIWDTLVKINKNNSVEGFGKLFQSN